MNEWMNPLLGKAQYMLRAITHPRGFHESLGQSSPETVHWFHLKGQLGKNTQLSIQEQLLSL